MIKQNQLIFVIILIIMDTIPTSFYKYFWDVNPSYIDIQKQSDYVSERLLELGNSKCLLWLEKTYGKEFLKNVISKSRSLSLKSVNFYSYYYDIDPKNILCLQEDYRNQHKKIWNH